MGKTAALQRIRKVIEDSDLTMVDSDGSTCFDWIEEEISDIMPQIKVILEDELLEPEE